MHAVRVAEEIGLSAAVIIPPFAGVLSALGLLVADYARISLPSLTANRWMPMRRTSFAAT